MMDIKEKIKVPTQDQNLDSKNVKEKSNSDKKGRFLKGVVFSDKMDKTITVLVNRYRKHSKYKKRYKVSKKYKVHDEKNEYKKGDKVIIHECRPISKDKQWEIVNKIN